MENKFQMSLQENIFLARRNIVDIIWKSAKLAGINVTFPDTEAIYNGLVVSDMEVNTVVAVNNLKHAWQFILDTIEYPIDYPYICKINQYVGSNLVPNAGFIRSYPVPIGGTKWKPELPIEIKTKEEIAVIKDISNPTEQAITMMLHLMRRQMFGDGNKRTSMLAANQIMISNGVGIISIPVELQRQFSKMLVEFYETNKMEDIKYFIYNSCIEGIPLESISTKNIYNPNDDYYLKVSFDEAEALEKQGIKFEGTIQKTKPSIIRINTADKDAVEKFLVSYRNSHKQIIK
ncbi:MAG: Fic family protein [Ruminococcus sp.]